MCKDQMPAGQCQVSNKCNQLTTFCLRNNYIANPRTAPDLSLRLQRAFWGMLLQIVLDSCDSRMQMKLSESFWPKQVNQVSLWSNWKMWLSRNYDIFVDVFRLNSDQKIVQFFKSMCLFLKSSSKFWTGPKNDFLWWK